MLLVKQLDKPISRAVIAKVSYGSRLLRNFFYITNMFVHSGLFWTALFSLFLVPSVRAEGVRACALEAGETVRIVSIVDGDTVGLADGREIRLVGLQAPKLGLGRANFVDWPLAEEARARLAGMVLNRSVQMSYGGSRQDRYGRLLAHLHLNDGSWVQARMVAAGLARVYSFADNRACTRALLAFERDAREDRRGLWSLDYFAIRSADNLAGLLQLENSFQLVEGRVRDVALVRGRAFMNFGTDWRDDFTIMVAPRDLRKFTEGVELYAGALVRVRGWLKSYNGPEIIVTHPEQIEILSEPVPPS